jgi:hypothetical protein
MLSIKRDRKVRCTCICTIVVSDPRPSAVVSDRMEGLVRPIVNGMTVNQLPVVIWQKSGRSNPSGNCVECAILPDGAGIAVRNSRDPEGPALIYTTAEMEAFILGVRDGDFDNLIE